MPSVLLNCLATSVFPTPVGPENKYEPMGLPSSRSPALASFIEDDNSSIALFCPKTKYLHHNQVEEKAHLSNHLRLL